MMQDGCIIVHSLPGDLFEITAHPHHEITASIVSVTETLESGTTSHSPALRFEDVRNGRRWEVNLERVVAAPQTSAEEWCVDQNTAELLGGSSSPMLSASKTSAEMPSGVSATSLSSITCPRYVTKDITWRYSTTDSHPTTTTVQRSETAPSSTLAKLKKDELLSGHRLLVQHIIQHMAPQALTVAQVVKDLCSANGVCKLEAGAVFKGSTATTSAAEMVSSAALGLDRYSAADVVHVVGVLTVPHRSRPKLRELRDESYVLLKIDAFADGVLRRKAANRAYPALAHRASDASVMALMNSMERYVDRDVVLETRKRHPRIMDRSVDPLQSRQKRSRSASPGPSDVEEEEQNQQPKLPESASATAAFSYRFDHLYQYPHSLQRGSLRDWAEAGEIQRLVQKWKRPATSETTQRLTELPIQCHTQYENKCSAYDTLAFAETQLTAKLAAHAGMINALQHWYSGVQKECSPNFNAELQRWLSEQQLCREDLLRLQAELHTVRYEAERSLLDYVHLHALGVL